MDLSKPPQMFSPGRTRVRRHSMWCWTLQSGTVFRSYALPGSLFFLLSKPHNVSTSRIYYPRYLAATRALTRAWLRLPETDRAAIHVLTAGRAFAAGV